MPAVGPLRIKTYLETYRSKISCENILLNWSGCNPASLEISIGKYFSRSWMNFMKYSLRLSLAVQQYCTIIKKSILLCHNRACDIAMLFPGDICQHTCNRAGRGFIFCNFL